MKHAQIPTPSLDELATTAVRLGRALAELARAVSLGAESPDVAAVGEMLRRLAARTPFDPGDAEGLEALREILEAELETEVVRVERQFVETRFDAYGQHGELRDCPVYSQRGQDLLAVQTALTAFIAARDATLDRVAAQCALRELLAT